MVCKIGFTNWNAKIALLRASMVVTTLNFSEGRPTDNSILMSLFLLVAETIRFIKGFQRIIDKFLLLFSEFLHLSCLIVLFSMLQSCFP